MEYKYVQRGLVLLACAIAAFALAAAYFQSPIAIPWLPVVYCH